MKEEKTPIFQIKHYDNSTDGSNSSPPLGRTVSLPQNTCLPDVHNISESWTIAVSPVTPRDSKTPVEEDKEHEKEYLKNQHIHPPRTDNFEISYEKSSKFPK